MNKSKSVSIKSLKSIKRKDTEDLVTKFADEYVGLTHRHEGDKKSPKGDDRVGENIKPHDTQLKLIEESRFTLVIPSYLHTRIKKHCVVNGVSMKTLLTDILLKEFPER